MRHAVIECRSDRYLRVRWQWASAGMGRIAGIFTDLDQRFRPSASNFPINRDGRHVNRS